MAPQNFDPKQLQDFLNLLGQVNTTMQGTLDMLTVHGQQVHDIFEKISDEFGSLNTDAKQFVTHLEDSKQEFSAIAKFANSINLKKVLETQHLDKVQKYFENIARIAEKIRDTKSYAAADRDAAAKTLEVVKKQLEEINRIATATPAKMHKALDADVAKKFNKEIETLEKRLGLVSKKLEDMRHPLMAVGESLRETFGDVRLFAPFTQAWDRFQSGKARAQITQQKAQENMEKGAAIFQTKIADRKGPMGDFLRGVRFKKGGDVDREFLEGMNRKQRTELRNSAKKLLGMDRGTLEAEVGKLSGYTGAGAGVERRAMTSRLMKAAQSLAGKGAEVGPEVEGLGGIAKGAGSLFTGLGEEAAGGIGAIAEKAGPWMVIASLLREGFDSMIDSNQQIFSQMGTSGLFTGRGQNAAGVFQTIRENLTPGVNVYGQTLETNQKIAATMDKFGVSVRELGDIGNNLGTNIIGTAGGRVGGGIATTIYGGARLAGLDETAATEQIMKLLTQYHESLKSTDAFFNRLNGDMKASGMTASRYLQILDEITSQFDHLARGIDDVTGAMRTLGHTGLLTQEQMQDAMKAMFTPHGTPEFAAAMNLMAPPELRGAGAAAARIDTKTAADKAYQTAQEFVSSIHPELKPEEVTALLKQRQITPEGLADINNATAADHVRRLATDLDPASTSIKKRDIGGALDVLRTRRIQQKQAESLELHPGPETAVAEAFQMNQGPAQVAMHNLRTISTLLPMAAGTNLANAWKMFTVNPEQLPPEFNVKFNKLLQMANMKPEEVNKMTVGVQSAAAELVTQARTGKVPTEMQQGVYGQLADALKIPQEGRSQADIMKDVQAALEDNTENQDKGQQALEGNFGTLTQQMINNKEMMAAYLQESQDQGDKAVQDQKEALGFALTKSGTYLEQIYTLLKTEFLGLVTDIVDGLATLVPGMKHTQGYIDRQTAAAAKAEAHEDQGEGVPAERLLEEYRMGSDVKGSLSSNLNKAASVLQELPGEISQASSDLETATKAGDKTAIATATRKHADLLSRYKQLQADADALQAAKPGVMGETLDTAQIASIEGRIPHLAALLAAEDKYRQGGPYVPHGAGVGDASQSPGVQPAKGKGEGNVSMVTNNENTVNISHVNSDPPQHNTDVTKHKEITSGDARRQAAAAQAAAFNAISKDRQAALEKAQHVMAEWSN
jgi:hypothetical protein